ncbi:MAG: outer membrane lipoprotein carrier protein LolA [Acidobacteria bacterium]|nr:outer membrane lipoprotein carrier protein LolA [Acidobacteriota bacterium]
MARQRGWVVAVIAATALVIFGPAAPRATDLFDEIYEKGQPLESSLETLTARFTETSSSPLLQRPLVARGVVSVLRPSKVRLDYDEPEARTVLINDEVLTVVWPSRDLKQQSNIGPAQRRIERSFVAKSPAELRSHFDIRASVAADRAGTWLLHMTPKRRQIREGLSTLELWLDRETVMLQAMRMTFPSGDTKLMEFAEVTINPPIDEAIFKK